MNIFLSLYIIVDGYFVANFVGKTEFAAIITVPRITKSLKTCAKGV
jgi:Na+-driven multidrug efflux pump